jgi:hypothetical protein
MITPALIRSLWEQGQCDTEISRSLSVPFHAVYKIRRSLNLPAIGKRGVRKGTPSARRGKPPPVSQCWGCGALAKRCSRSTTLQSQGWGVYELMPGVRECYCPACLSAYGPPSLWGHPYAPPEPPPEEPRDPPPRETVYRLRLPRSIIPQQPT